MTEADGRLSSSFEYLENLYRRPILPPARAGLERIHYLLKRLGNPERDFPSVHVTGTCGKGSTATMIGSVLDAAGYRTGLFRSPHLDSYRERIALGSKMITGDDWVECFEAVRSVADAMEAGEAADYSLGRVSLFEFVWAMAAWYFARSKADFAVVEVGVGGRLSATNVLEPEVAVLTNISLDHTELLGHSEVDIAAEKAAIIKSGGDASTAATQDDVLEIIRSRCEQVGAALWTVGREVRYNVRHHDLGGEVVDIDTPRRSHTTLSIPLLGNHQVVNAATAVAATDQLAGRGVDIEPAAVSEGLAHARFPGRFEIASQEPLVVLDGARNAASAATLRATLDDLFPNKDVILLIGVLKDKDAGAIADRLAPRARAAVVTRPPWEGRVGDLSALTTTLSQSVAEVEYRPEVSKAFEAARCRCRPNDLLLVTGSLYLVAAIRHILLTGSTLSGYSDQLQPLAG